MALAARVVAVVALGLAAVAAAPAVARAQPVSCQHPIAGGIQGGMNASSWLGSDDDRIHLGAWLGGFAVFRLAHRLALEVDLALSDKGADFEDASGDRSKEALLYLEAPVLARYDLALTGPLSLHGLAGPGLAWLTDSKRTPKGDLRPIDVTFTTGAGVDLAAPSHHLSLDLRLGFGFVDAVDDGARKARAVVVTLLGGVTL